MDFDGITSYCGATGTVYSYGSIIFPLVANHYQQDTLPRCSMYVEKSTAHGASGLGISPINTLSRWMKRLGLAVAVSITDVWRLGIDHHKSTDFRKTCGF